LGFGTFFMVLITFGLWLFVIPFYPKRCAVCGCVRSATNIKEGLAQRSPWEIIGLVAVLLVILVAVFSNNAEDKATPIADSAAVSSESTPINNSGPVSNDIASANVETSSHVENHEVKVSPNYFGGNPISDGRTYSVALIAAASEIPVGTELFAQGRVVSFGYASIRSRPFVILEDEQQTGKMLLCAMAADEGAEVISLYHPREAVQVYGEYMGTLSIAGNPSMPTFSNCKVASPTDKVVRPEPAPPVPAQVPEARPAIADSTSELPSEKDTTAPSPQTAETDSLTGVYSGKVHNTWARIWASFDTTIQVDQGGAISGCMLVHRPLYGSGRLSGESRAPQVTFSVPSSVGVIRFTGVRAGQSITGTYVVQRSGSVAEYGEFELHRGGGLPANFDSQNCPNDSALN
jgi:hypothetical protein